MNAQMWARKVSNGAHLKWCLGVDRRTPCSPSPWWIFFSADAPLSSDSMLLQKSQCSLPMLPTWGCAFHPSCDALWGFLPPQRITLVWWSCLVREIQIRLQHTHTHPDTQPSPLSQQACSSSPAPEFPWGSGQRQHSDTCLPIYLPLENSEGPQWNSKGTDTHQVSWPSPVNVNWSEASQELKAGLYWGSCTHMRE